jgi:HD-like signal output (HDOD) protein
MRAMPVAHQFLSKPCEAKKLIRVLTQACHLQDIIADQRLQASLGDIGQLPARPETYSELCRIFAGDEWSLADAARVVERDVSISMKVLQVANTAFFRRGGPVKEVSQAVSRLGARFLRDLVLGLEAFQRFPSVRAADVDPIHRDGLLVAVAARKIAPASAADDAFLAGMVHDIGRIVIASFLPQAAKAIATRARAHSESPLEAEAAVLGMTHAEIGAYLLGLWGMPYPVIDAVCQHHRPDRISEPELGASGAVYLAATLSDEAEASEIDHDYLERVGATDSLQHYEQLVQEARQEAHGIT